MSSVVGPLRSGVAVAGRVALVGAAVVWTDGGQGTARRNAWTAMVADARRRRDRMDADVALGTTSPVAVAPAVPLPA